jgi:hypothetical protein
MKRHRWVTAVVAVLLAVMVPAAPANASEDEFTWLGCAGQPKSTTGNLTGYQPGDFYGGAWQGLVTGSIQPCRAPVHTDVFAIASYYSDGTVTASATRYLDSADYSAGVTVRLKTAAVCLIDNLKSRLDCVKVGWLEQQAGPAQPVLDGHLPVDSPLVASAPVVTMDGMTIDPGCPTCVNDQYSSDAS